MLDVSDRIAIADLVALYGHLLDQRRWQDFDLVFTDDVHVEGMNPTTDGIAEKIAQWTSEEGMKRHPVAHHITNPYVTEDPDGTVRMICKGIMVRVDGPPTSIVYEDVVVRTDRGWRIASRKVINRTEQALAGS
jgi:3-phenylpropionate/cinnamic acid dioxygenase small subunit